MFYMRDERFAAFGRHENEAGIPKIAAIICGGSMDKPAAGKAGRLISEASYVICADGGLNYAIKFGIMPDWVVGDFDSIDDNGLEFCRANNIKTVKYPREKDMSDSEIAVEQALKEGCDVIAITGGFGGTRLDHMVGNIFLLKKIYDRGAWGIAADSCNEAVVTGRGRMTIPYEDNVYISLLPLSDAVGGIVTEGLRFPLSNETVELGSTRGLSNEFSEKSNSNSAPDPAYVSIGSGTLLIIKSPKRAF